MQVFFLIKMFFSCRILYQTSTFCYLQNLVPNIHLLLSFFLVSLFQEYQYKDTPWHQPFSAQSFSQDCAIYAWSCCYKVWKSAFKSFNICTLYTFYLSMYIKFTSHTPQVYKMNNSNHNKKKFFLFLNNPISKKKKRLLGKILYNNHTIPIQQQKTGYKQKWL